MTGHDRTASPSEERDAHDVEFEKRVAEEQDHQPEGRPPGPAAGRFSIRLAAFLLTLGAVAALVTTYIVGGWDAMGIGVAVVLVLLLVGASPYLLALWSRAKSKRHARERVVEKEA